MQLTDTLNSMMRRWYLVLTGLALTVGVAWMAYATIPPRYEAAGSVLLMPSEATVGDEGNPYLYLGGMNDAMDVLIRRTNAPEVQQQLLADHAGATYTVEKDATTQSPIVVVTVASGTDGDAVAVLQDTLSAVHAKLGEMQDDLSIPQERRISLKELVVDDVAAKNTKTPVQVAVAAAGAGGVATLLLTGVIDGYLVRRGRAHHGRRASVEDGTESPLGTPLDIDAAERSDVLEAPRR
jgi:hypothetical protein